MSTPYLDYWKTWTPLFPEYRHADRVAIIGFARTSRDMVPWEDPNVDFWTLNEALTYDWCKCKEPAMHWQMHPVFDYMRKFNRNDPKHWRWLQQEYPFPIMMQNKYADVPSSVAYPLHDAIQAFTMYFTSTPAYMLALAILMGYKQIDIYGIEMSADSEYVYQKAAFEYLIGFARGRGIEVYIPPKCSLLRAALYGYEDLRAASRVYYEYRLKQLQAVQTQKEQALWEAIGQNNCLLTLTEDPHIQENRDVLMRILELRDQQEEKINEANRILGQASGAVHEMRELINWHESQSVADDREDVEVHNAK